MVNKKTMPKKAKEAKQVKTVDELKVELAAKQGDLLDSKKGHKQGELINHCILRSTRKEIARLHTAINILSKTDEFVKQREEK